MIIYDGFWTLLKQKRMSQRFFSFQHEISPSRLQAMRNGEYITVRTLEKLCRVLSCTPEMLISVEEDSEIYRIVQFAQEEESEAYGAGGQGADQRQYLKQAEEQ